MASDRPSARGTANGDAADQGEVLASTGLGDIVVTARRVSENLQDVPVSITAISGQGLERRNVTQVQDLAQVVPGLTMRPAINNASGLNVQIRGQFQNDNIATLDPSVGTYVDGLYWARAYGLNADLVDVRSVQVLRGPQGTLFGRNTTGGAVLIETNDPDADRFTARVSGTYGRFNERGGTAVLNLPLVEDRLSLRVAGNFVKRDGYIRSVPFDFNGVSTPTEVVQGFPFSPTGGSPTLQGSTGRKLGERNSYTVRAKLLFEPTQNFKILLAGEQFRTRASSQTQRLAVIGNAPGLLPNLEAGVELGAPLESADRLGQSFFDAYIPMATGSDTVSLNQDPLFYTRTRTITGTATLDTFFGEVKFIGGYRGVKSNNDYDLDGSPIFILDTFAEQDLSQYSGELQFNGKTANDRLEFTAGIYYFEESGYDRSTSITAPVLSTLGMGPTSLRNSYNYGDIDGRSQAIFGQATYKITDRLSVVGGLRYSVEDKGLTIYNRTLLRDTGALVTCSISGAPVDSSPQPCRVGRSDSFDGISYTAGVNFKANEDALIYAKTSKGFRSGGQQLRATGSNGGFVPFDPEVSVEHEIGAKTELFGRRLRLNMAAFLSEVSDLQRSTVLVFSEAGSPRTATVIGNAGKSRTYGGEMEATVLLLEGFSLTGTLAHVKPKYLNYRTPNGTSGEYFDRRSDRFDQVPSWQWSLGGNYNTEFNWGKLDLNANFAWQAATPIRDVNFTFDREAETAQQIGANNVYSIETAEAILDATTQRAGGELNLRATITIMDGALELAAWGRNVTNFRPNISALFFAAPLTSVSVVKRDPATYGGTITYRFGR